MLLQTTPKSFHERGWSRLHLAGSSSLIYLHRPTVRVPPLLRDYRFGPNSREKANPPSMMTPRGSHTLVLATRWFWPHVGSGGENRFVVAMGGLCNCLNKLFLLWSIWDWKKNYTGATNNGVPCHPLGTIAITSVAMPPIKKKRKNMVSTEVVVFKHRERSFCLHNARHSFFFFR